MPNAVKMITFMAQDGARPGRYFASRIPSQIATPRLQVGH